MPNGLRALAWSLVTSCPFSSSWPLGGRSMVVNILIVLILPAPLGPKKAKISPGFIAKLTLSTALMLPKVLTTPRTSTAYLEVIEYLLYSSRLGRLWHYQAGNSRY